MMYLLNLKDKGVLGWLKGNTEIDILEPFFVKTLYGEIYYKANIPLKGGGFKFGVLLHERHLVPFIPEDLSMDEFV